MPGPSLVGRIDLWLYEVYLDSTAKRSFHRFYHLVRYFSLPYIHLYIVYFIFACFVSLLLCTMFYTQSCVCKLEAYG